MKRGYMRRQSEKGSKVRVKRIGIICCVLLLLTAVLTYFILTTPNWFNGYGFSLNTEDTLNSVDDIDEEIAGEKITVPEKIRGTYFSNIYLPLSENDNIYIGNTATADAFPADAKVYENIQEIDFNNRDFSCVSINAPNLKRISNFGGAATFILRSDKIEEINMSDIKVLAMDLMTPNLKELDISNMHEEVVLLLKCPKLETIYLYSNRMDEVEVDFVNDHDYPSYRKYQSFTNCPSLKHIYATYDKKDEYDWSTVVKGCRIHYCKYNEDTKQWEEVESEVIQ